MISIGLPCRWSNMGIEVACSIVAVSGRRQGNVFGDPTATINALLLLSFLRSLKVDLSRFELLSVRMLINKWLLRRWWWLWTRMLWRRGRGVWSDLGWKILNVSPVDLVLSLLSFGLIHSEHEESFLVGLIGVFIPCLVESELTCLLLQSVQQLHLNWHPALFREILQSLDSVLNLWL